MKSRIECYCARCGEYRPRTKHHVFPKRHFGKGKKNATVVFLCEDCHRNIEAIIEIQETLRGGCLTRAEYEDLTARFLRGDYSD